MKYKIFGENIIDKAAIQQLENCMLKDSIGVMTADGHRGYSHPIGGAIAYKKQKMKLWKWQEGRQGITPYWKFPLWYFKIWKWGFDAYILKYAPKALLRAHTDPVENGKHWRLNIKLKGIAWFSILKGMHAHSYGRWETTQKRFILFRPDLFKHSLLVGPKGCLKLSFGFVKYK